ncbi:MAG: hypothetical protein K6U89_17300 [Chloroflexi bacterium]|nr:hypothetical protein [Chloroflexota bacterium]
MQLRRQAWTALGALRTRVSLHRFATDDAIPGRMISLLRYANRGDFDLLYGVTPPEIVQAMNALVIPGTLRRSWFLPLRDYDNFALAPQRLEILEVSAPAGAVSPFQQWLRQCYDGVLLQAAVAAIRMLQHEEAVTVFALIVERATLLEPAVLPELPRTTPPPVAPAALSSVVATIRFDADRA